LGYLIDRFGRKITYIRFSITPRCNFDCVYCTAHKPENSNGEEFSVDDIKFLFSVANELGIEKVRLTGGEPLIRSDIVDVVKALKSNHVKEIVLTTNGFYLEKIADKLKASGVSRVNVSLDTLRNDVFKEITKMDAFYKVKNGIERALRVGLTPVKINTVLMKGINEDDILPIAELSFRKNIIVRFIELMPVKGNDFWRLHYMSFRKAMDIIKSKYELIPIEGNKSEVADYYKIKGAPGKIGFITPISQHFCSRCNRIRITSSGRIYPCLFSKEYVSVWAAVKNRDRALLISLIKESVYIKPKEHGVIRLNDHDFINDMRELGG
jgi:cyclic pyranopterin phosphate synthase